MANRNPSKRCSRCGQTKPLSEYNHRVRGAPGLRASCRQCQHYTEGVRRKARQGSPQEREAHMRFAAFEQEFICRANEVHPDTRTADDMAIIFVQAIVRSAGPIRDQAAFERWSKKHYMLRRTWGQRRTMPLVVGLPAVVPACGTKAGRFNPC